MVIPIGIENIELYDGGDLLIFSETINLYENKLVVKNVFDNELVFIFEDKTGQLEQDIQVKSEEKRAVITFSKKIRNILGSGTTKKIPIINLKDGRKVLLSLYSTQIGDNAIALNVTVNLYIEKYVQ